MAMDDDKELGPIPAHIRTALESADDLDDYLAHPRWVCVKHRGVLIHPRSEIACMLRAGDRRRGTTDSLKAINYGPIELFLDVIGRHPPAAFPPRLV